MQPICENNTNTQHKKPTIDSEIRQHNVLSNATLSSACAQGRTQATSVKLLECRTEIGEFDTNRLPVAIRNRIAVQRETPQAHVE